LSLGEKAKTVLSSIRKVYSIKYAALNVAVAIAYYIILVELVRYQNYGILVFGVPKLLIYALVVSSSVMFTIGVYYTARRLGSISRASASIFGTMATVFTGVVVGCGCSAPILFGIGSLFFSAVELSVAESYISGHGALIVSVLLAINAVLIIYYFGRISAEDRV
jgi:hypothetical protein